MNRNKTKIKTHRKTKYICFLLFTGLLLTILARATLFNYKSNVNSYNEIGISQIDKLKSGEIIYIGRSTCPACSKFVPTLRDGVKESKTSLKRMHYLDTEKSNKNNTLDFKKFLLKNKIKSIPTLAIKTREGKLLTKSFSGETTEKEINDFLKTRR